jgi:phosphatidate cytidylyltransferase
LLRWRLLLGTVLIVALVGLMRLDTITSPPGAWLLPLVLALGLAAAQEVVNLLTAGGHRPRAYLICGGTLLVLASNAIPLVWVGASEQGPLERLAWPLLAFTLALMAALVGEMLRYRQPGASIVNVALVTFAVAYVGVLLSFAFQLRALGGPVEGMIALVAMIAVVKLGDTGAYTVGRLFGRHKMAPLISPGKTLEGAAGGLAAGCLGAWLSLVCLPQWLDATIAQPAWGWVVFGLAVGLAGMVGDLAESLLKRDMGRKDSSDWLPGFGGVLDLVDSILFAAPVAYGCWLLLVR